MVDSVGGGVVKDIFALAKEIKAGDISLAHETSAAFFKYEKEMFVMLKNETSGITMVVPADTVFTLAQAFGKLADGGMESTSKYFH